MTKWILKQIDNELLEKLQNGHLPLSPVLSKLLILRKCTTEQQVKNFLNPLQENVCHSPFLLKDLELAKQRLIRAMKEKEQLVIYSDYDADGITAAALFYHFLQVYQYQEKEIVKAHFIIPDRIEDGYGLKPKGVYWAKKQNATLLITIDNGISSNQAIDVANSLGIDVIIIDHHTVPDVVPSAFAIINPKQKECQYPFADLTSVGLIYKVLSVMAEELLTEENRQKFLYRFLDLVAIGTYQDVAPLIDENRYFVMAGLKVINQLMKNELSTNLNGIKHLLTIAKYGYSNVSEWALGFCIGPRINASGRIDSSHLPFQLLIEKQSDKANQLALTIEEINKQRKSLVHKGIQEALIMVKRDQLFQYPILILASHHWHKGIIGLIATEITKTYHKPAMVFSTMHDPDVLTGSCRSPDYFDITLAISRQSHLLLAYGGHKKAAGLSLSHHNYALFKENMIQYAKEVITSTMTEKHILIDMELEFKDMNEALKKDILALSPFGEENPFPVFVIRTAKIRDIHISKRGLDTVVSTEQQGIIMPFVFFNNIRYAHQFSRNDVVDIVLHAKPTFKNDMEDVVFEILDMKISEKQ